jgi:hypothetical protein
VFAELKELSEDDGLDERHEIESLKLTLQKILRPMVMLSKLPKTHSTNSFVFIIPRWL